MKVISITYQAAKNWENLCCHSERLEATANVEDDDPASVVMALKRFVLAQLCDSPDELLDGDPESGRLFEAVAPRLNSSNISECF